MLLQLYVSGLSATYREKLFLPGNGVRQAFSDSGA